MLYFLLCIYLGRWAYWYYVSPSALAECSVTKAISHQAKVAHKAFPARGLRLTYQGIGWLNSLRHAQGKQTNVNKVAQRYMSSSVQQFVLIFAVRHPLCTSLSLIVSVSVFLFAFNFVIHMEWCLSIDAAKKRRNWARFHGLVSSCFQTQLELTVATCHAVLTADLVLSSSEQQRDE